MRAISLGHILAFLVWFFGLVNLLHQFFGVTIDVLHFFYFLGQQNFSGALQAGISIGAIILGILIHVSVVKLDS